MKLDRNIAWSQFLHTGSVQDYLRYARTAHAAMNTGEDAAPDEDDGRWNRDRNAQYE